MRIIEARNVHQALPKALAILDTHGVQRGSRNGEVRQAPWPVITDYAAPCERVIFWPQRDANPAFHLYEALWMIAGRNDLAPLLRYVKTFGNFSDDGQTLYGAYGHRWRMSYDMDQLELIATRLEANPDDRRCVLSMWMAEYDLDRNGKDVPCNLTATFQRDHLGALDMTVFCRSNDLILGAYGANAVHFGLLLEYMAVWIGCPTGHYRQVSVNWHAYLNDLKRLDGLFQSQMHYAQPHPIDDPYVKGTVKCTYLLAPRHYTDDGDARMHYIDRLIRTVLAEADHGTFGIEPLDEPFFDVARAVLRAHHAWRTRDAPGRFAGALEILNSVDKTLQEADWIVAMRQWIERRMYAHAAKQETADAAR